MRPRRLTMPPIRRPLSATRFAPGRGACLVQRLHLGGLLCEGEGSGGDGAGTLESACALQGGGVRATRFIVAGRTAA
jgi:hypothetical protein